MKHYSSIFNPFNRHGLFDCSVSNFGEGLDAGNLDSSTVTDAMHAWNAMMAHCREIVVGSHIAIREHNKFIGGR